METVKKTEIEVLENSAVKLTVTVKKEKTEESYKALLSQHAKEAHIKGFRKGKVPSSILEQKFGESIKHESFFNLIDQALKEAFENVDKKPLQTATPTLVDEDKLKFELGKDFKFSVKYDIYPESEIAEYEGTEIEVADCKILKADMDAELSKIQEQNAMMIDKSEGSVADKDNVTINYCEIDKDKNPISSTEGQDFSFTVGSGYAPYKIDKEIIGMKKDESKIIKKSFEKDDSDEKLAGRTVDVKVTVTSIKEKDLPALDDELAQDVSDDFKTFDDLKADVKKRLDEQLQTKLKDIKFNALVGKVIENSKIELPESMIKAELDNNLKNFAAQSGMQPEQLLEIIGSQGGGTEELFKEWRPSTIKNIKQSLIIDSVVKKEDFKISDKEIGAEYDKIALQSRKPVSEIKEYYKANNAEEYLKHNIQADKAIDLMISKAKIKKGKKVSFLDLIGKN